MIPRRCAKLLVGALLPWLAALLAPVASAQAAFPALTGRVVDGANVIPADVEARLTRALELLEKQSRHQLVVATVPSLQGRDIADFGYQLGRVWGIGDEQRDDGVLLLVAPAERKVRIETGYGVEAVLPDALNARIVDDAIVPRFKAGDLPGGIEAGTDAIARQLQLPAAEARQVAAAAGRRRQGGTRIPIVPIVLVLFVLFFFVLPVVRSLRGRRRLRGGWGAPIVWVGSHGSRSGGGSSGSSGSGGGFSGGGGSFGGGGASGSW